MWERMITFLESWFIYSNLAWDLMLIGIGLAIVFGALWLSGHWPPLFKKYWLWVVATFSAFFTLLAVVFVQIPLQHYTGRALAYFWSQDVLINWILLAGIPQILLSGLVQEGAKMVPMVVWWWRSGRNITPRLGLAIGAMAGAGFGIFEAVWAHNNIFASGWTWEWVESGGLIMLAGFWERLAAVGFHIAVSALAGYGLAKGLGWQFYLIASGLHALLNYSAVLFAEGILTIIQVEIYASVIAVLVTAAALWLRWRKTPELAELEISAV
jgi:RsiW-degrading membrane proteinase PrsW (M82 family)